MKRHIHKNDNYLKMELRFNEKKFGRIFTFENKNTADILIMLPHVFSVWEESVKNLIEGQNETKTESNTN